MRPPCGNFENKILHYRPEKDTVMTHHPFFFVQSGVFKVSLSDLLGLVILITQFKHGCNKYVEVKRSTWHAMQHGGNTPDDNVLNMVFLK